MRVDMHQDDTDEYYAEGADKSRPEPLRTGMEWCVAKLGGIDNRGDERGRHALEQG